MDEMRVYLINLGKYNEGELVGDWFTPLIDEEEVRERIELNGEYEGYAIHNYELPFEISENISIDDINHMCEMVSELPEHIQRELKELLGYFQGLEDLYDCHEDIIYYPDCENMSGVARELAEQLGLLDMLSPNVRECFDYEAYGRLLEYNSNYVITNSGVYEIRH